MMKQLHVTVFGRVQGVSFRYYTIRAAKQIGGITGWVANQRDGTVKVVAEGEEAQLAALLDFLRQGSPAATVTHLEHEWGAAGRQFRTFQTRYL